MIIQNELRAAFHWWRNFVQQVAVSDAIQGEKRKMLIVALESFLKGNSKALLREVLLRFSTGAKRAKLIRVINLRLLKTVAGGVFDSFNKWKSIPFDSSKDLAKGSKFETALSHFEFKFLKRHTWLPLRSFEEQAQIKQKRIVNAFIWNTMSDWNRAFYIWHQVTREQKIID